MSKITVALLSGGISSERDVSIKSGNEVYKALNKDKYEIIRYDPKTDIAKIVTDHSTIDIALIIMHGRYGEDGTIQGLLDLLGIPYQGSGVLASALAMDKLISKKLYESEGLKVPPYMVIDQHDYHHAKQSVRHLGLPVVLKPVKGGSSIGMDIVFNESDLSVALENAFQYDRQVILESYLEGVEVTGGVLGNIELTPLPLIEIIPGKDHRFFDYEAKYKPGATQEICPARLNANMTEKAQESAMKAHKALDCRGCSRTDMIICDDTIYILETNTIPGMTPTSLLPQAAQAGGFNFSQLLDHLIELGMQK
ncbi:MAG: D-alanine-D-alanine ligase [Candidatus Magnetoglobus multicellularis str. Araruama]|uniref:D-alanine--D-alanine ligase n=1 Tax=Candidatus Magnetoglobus multicellularis str. Araruama TaxID=890399 RepID=A0A1V1P0D1_9BACT|nr:MAG: D-alanine-D-alanine ligase [Candidatus Magnetoglobus multicellularis str. Araruama]